MEGDSAVTTNQQRSSTTQPLIGGVPPPPDTPPSNLQETGVNAAIIATVINIVFTFLLYHTYNFNILAAGLYLGFSKGVGPKTKPIFYISNLVFIFLDNAIFKKGLYDPVRGPVGAVFVTALSSALLAAIPLGIMWVIRKIKKA